MIRIIKDKVKLEQDPIKPQWKDDKIYFCVVDRWDGQQRGSWIQKVLALGHCDTPNASSTRWKHLINREQVSLPFTGFKLLSWDLD